MKIFKYLADNKIDCIKVDSEVILSNSGRMVTIKSNTLHAIVNKINNRLDQQQLVHYFFNNRKFNLSNLNYVDYGTCVHYNLFDSSHIRMFIKYKERGILIRLLGNDQIEVNDSSSIYKPRVISRSGLNHLAKTYNNNYFIFNKVYIDETTVKSIGENVFSKHNISVTKQLDIYNSLKSIGIEIFFSNTANIIRYNGKERTITPWELRTKLNKFKRPESFMREDIKCISSLTEDEILKHNITTHRQLHLYKLSKHRNVNIRFEDEVYIATIDVGDKKLTAQYQLIRDRLTRYSDPDLIFKPVGDCCSNKEKDFISFIKSIYKEEVVENSREIIPPKELDLYLPNKGIAFEFNGIYWHSLVDKNYHINKSIKCNEKGIRLIHIWEDLWENKPDIYKSIITGLLSIDSYTKIYGRKVTIFTPTKDEVDNFLNMTHLQGACNYTVALGLKFNNEIVSVCTFSKNRKIYGNNDDNLDEWELVRYSTLLNTVVIGGFSKLINCFMKQYKPKVIITYCNTDIFVGNVYEKAGFIYIKNTSPGYFYIKGMTRYHRFNFTKHSLVEKGYDKDKTESEIMSFLGFSKLYNTGNKLFKLTCKQ